MQKFKGFGVFKKYFITLTKKNGDDLGNNNAKFVILHILTIYMQCKINKRIC